MDMAPSPSDDLGLHGSGSEGDLESNSGDSGQRGSSNSGDSGQRGSNSGNSGQRGSNSGDSGLNDPKLSASQSECTTAASSGKGGGTNTPPGNVDACQGDEVDPYEDAERVRQKSDQDKNRGADNVKHITSAMGVQHSTNTGGIMFVKPGFYEPTTSIGSRDRAAQSAEGKAPLLPPGNWNLPGQTRSQLQEQNKLRCHGQQDGPAYLTYSAPDNATSRLSLDTLLEPEVYISAEGLHWHGYDPSAELPPGLGLLPSSPSAATALEPPPGLKDPTTPAWLLTRYPFRAPP